MKKCTQCKLEKPLSEFYKISRSKDGLESCCRQCHNARKSAYYQQNKEQIAQYNRQYNEENKEHIKACKSAHYQKNRDLILEKTKIYQGQHKERDKARKSADYQKNRDLIRERQKIYQEQHKEQLTQYRKHRRKSDPVFYLSRKIQKSILRAFNNKGYTKRSRTHEILGCSFIEFKEHLEKQFVNGLSWENRSEWHIDHVIPISSAKTEEEVIRLNHYTNLQPLWAVDNLKKSNKMPDLEVPKCLPS